ncbi:MAG: M23 family metallopeptidase [Gemmatimonadota bacterium]|nr:M23 family metallopeptidase [Gemmatimonadota bacterium]
MTPRIRSALLVPLLLAGCSFSTTPPSAPAPARSEPRILGHPVVSAGSLLIPVAGVSADRLRDSYNDPRSGGRVHHAIDIMAPHRTPVLAAADARVLKLHNSAAGGTSLYLLDRDGVTRYYYAHLDDYVAGLREGDEVFGGQVVAYVGDTGNAGRGNYHLHFSVAILSDAKRWWEGENINPYLLLTSSGARLTRAGDEERQGSIALP